MVNALDRFEFWKDESPDLRKHSEGLKAIIGDVSKKYQQRQEFG
jgi:hypothetical protein